MMKHLLTLTILFMLATHALAVDYYVSSSQGNDANTGQNQNTAFRTIEKVNSMTFAAGDRILFKCGDTWKNEALVIRHSGTASAPITFGSYPPGCADKPVISGSAPITGWTSHSGNIYVADLSRPANQVHFSKTDTGQILGINQLFRNGIRLMLGRWPNPGAMDNGYSTIDGYPSATSIVDHQLPAGDWQGAAVHIKSMRWLIINRIVSSSSGGTLNFSETTTCFSGTCAGWGYFVNHHLNTLDLDGEWFYDETAKKIYLFSSSGPPLGIEGSVITSESPNNKGCIILGPPFLDHVTIDNFELKNGFSHGLTSTGSMRGRAHGHITIQNMLIRDMDSTGMRLISYIWSAEQGEEGHRGGFDFNVLDNTVDGANHFGIDTFTRDSQYIGNTVKNIGLINNLGKSGLGCGFSGNSCTENGDGIRIRSWDPDQAGFNNLFQYNIIEKTGYNGMDIFGARNTVKNNLFTRACFTKGDCGAIRTFGQSSLAATPVHTITIQDNIIHDIPGNTDGTIAEYRSRFGMGIYVDHYSRDVDVIGNTVVNTTITGIYFGRSTGTATDNLVYNCGNNGDAYSSSLSAYGTPALVSEVTGNTVYALNEKAWTLGMDTPARFAVCDHNRIFHPYVDDHITYQKWDRTTFTNWQTLSGHDPHSATNWFSLNPGDPPLSRVFWNTTQGKKTIPLGHAVYQDLDQNRVAGSLTLDPYTSTLLILTDRKLYVPSTFLLLN
ncbi:MAG: right-handed parallel beta-helix repeat-containing protein [Desulfobacteraceae bacterium]|nr:MAG: right-handed parallel beta-helix repeat-containing protein [Desulfobacteraceae bacterium]